MRVYFISLCFIAAVLNLISCKKERSCEGCNTNNQPPIAIAGSDQAIILPTDSTYLNGSTSYDPDGRISTWQWSKLSGPPSFQINTPDSAKTITKSLVQGTYQFVLKVTDDKGATALDTISIIVNQASAVNLPPVACAGNDQTTTLPVNSAQLNGSCSTDPDNNIAIYSWTKISGPSSFNIQNPNATQTSVNNLVEGIYHFVLKVSDSGGLYSFDTVRITVSNGSCNIAGRPIINAQLTVIGHLSPSSQYLREAIQAGSKILFADGEETLIDIYDLLTNSWNIDTFSEQRNGYALTSLNNKVYFAGGNEHWGTSTSSIDIYDAVTNTWSIDQLSVNRTSAAGVSVGNRIIIAGGQPEMGGFPGLTTVDIFNTTTNSWSVTQLPEPMTELKGVAINGKAYFFGGMAHGSNGSFLNSLYIYDPTNGTWAQPSNLQLSQARTAFATIAVGNKIFIAGGRKLGQLLNSVEIIDVQTGGKTSSCLMVPRANLKVVRREDDLIFFTGTLDNIFMPADTFDIYNLNTGQWSVGKLPFSLSGSAIVTVGNEIWVAGGYTQTQPRTEVWKLTW